MKTLYLSIIVILATSLVIVNNNVFADNSIQSTSIDGTVTPTGCHIIHGTVTQATDIQNTTVQICNYNNKHFKLTDESDCMPFSMEQTGNGYYNESAGKFGYYNESTGKFYFPSVCDVPVTCGTNSDYVLGITHGDNIPTYEGAEQYIATIYPGNMCVSEAYNEQEKKITIIANGSDVVDHYPRCCKYVNYSQIDVLIPKGMLENITFTVDGKHLPTFGTSSTWLRPNQSDIEIDLPLSFVAKKIEITGYQKIPEFPIAIPVLLIGIVSVIVFYRMRINK
jgi:hypothetical protein